MTDDLANALRAIVDRLERLQIPYMIVGSVAGLAHGRPRATQDFDVVVDLDLDRLDALLAALPADRYYVSREAAVDALRRETLFNIIDMETGWKVDVVPLKRREFSRTELARRRPLQLLGMTVQVASVEDTIIAKLEWSTLAGGSARQLEDVRELLRAGSAIDRAYVESWIARLGLAEAWASALSP